MFDAPRKRFVTDHTVNSLHSCFTDIDLLKKPCTTSNIPLTKYEIAMIADYQLKHIDNVKMVADNVFKESERQAAESLIQFSSGFSSPSTSPVYIRGTDRAF